MIRIGEYQTLVVRREMPQGLYLDDNEANEVLLPQKYITPEMKIDSEVQVFVYCDTHDRIVATTEEPVFTVGEYALLIVNDSNHIGAFCAWGVNKDLFVPYSNQVVKMQPGRHYVVYMYLDEISERLVGTTKINKILKHIADDNLTMGKEVSLMVYNETELGYNVIIDQTYAGLIYKSEIPRPLRYGQTLQGYVKPIRSDGKIDISLTPVGHQSIEPNAQKLFDRLVSAGGFLPFHDKSDPDAIRMTFGISKKLFKKALGTLYKRKLIRMESDGIYKLEQPVDNKDAAEKTGQVDKNGKLEKPVDTSSTNTIDPTTK